MTDIPSSFSAPRWFALLFEAQSIQSYLFATNRLRDAVGGSELLDALTNHQTKGNLLDAVLQATQAHDHIDFSRRAGGAFYAFSKDADAMQRFVDLWVCALQRWAPEMDYSLSQASGPSVKEALDAARRALRGRRPQLHLPVASPATLRAQRTGAAAVGRDAKGDDIDAATVRKRAYANPAQGGFFQRFTPQDNDLGWRNWPLDFDPSDEGGAFPFLGESRTIAVIKGDGNGMGQALQLLAAQQKEGAEFIDLFRRFSEALAQSAQSAAHQATLDVLLPARASDGTLPARPLILGGDDLLVVVRADLALSYVRSFARAFEQESKLHLQSLSDQAMLPGMSMGFGVAYVSADHPFALAAAMAEALMKQAKTTAKERAARAHSPQQEQALAPSTVTFHRVTASLWADPHQQIEAETRVETPDGASYVHTLGCYALDAAQAQGFGLPALDDLFKLQDALQGGKIAHGAMRGLLNALETGEKQAREDYKRWREQMKRRNASALADFDTALRPLLPGADIERFPYARVQDGATEGLSCENTPLGDALTLRAVGNLTQTPSTAPSLNPSAEEAAA